jgi:hypothetical protein
MARDWESTFQGWASPPSDTEKTKCDHVERAVRQAIGEASHLRSHTITSFVQGSYANRTNVRLDSDVDIVVLCSDTYFYELPDEAAASSFGITPATYQYPEYKDDIQRALVSYFGQGAVSRGNKAFDIHENTYRVDADVVPCFEYRLFSKDGRYISGVSLLTDKGIRVNSFPSQHYQNGVAKNDATGRRFKSVVRILKQLRNEMQDNGNSHAKDVPSYLIESLLWNVSNDAFGHSNYTADVRWVLANLFNNTMGTEGDCTNWTEVNGIYYLFHPSQPWTVPGTHRFLSAAWDYIGFD